MQARGRLGPRTFDIAERHLVSATIFRLGATADKYSTLEYSSSPPCRRCPAWRSCRRSSSAWCRQRSSLSSRSLACKSLSFSPSLPPTLPPTLPRSLAHSLSRALAHSLLLPPAPSCSLSLSVTRCLCARSNISSTPVGDLSAELSRRLAGLESEEPEESEEVCTLTDTHTHTHTRCRCLSL